MNLYFCLIFSLGISQIDNIRLNKNIVNFSFDVFESAAKDFYENRSKNRNNAVKMKKLRDKMSEKLEKKGVHDAKKSDSSTSSKK